jgi:hypothetical protein
MRTPATVAAITRFCSSAKSGSAVTTSSTGPTPSRTISANAVVGVLSHEVRRIAGAASSMRGNFASTSFVSCRHTTSGPSPRASRRGAAAHVERIDVPGASFKADRSCGADGSAAQRGSRRHVGARRQPRVARIARRRAIGRGGGSAAATASGSPPPGTRYSGGAPARRGAGAGRALGRDFHGDAAWADFG